MPKIKTYDGMEHEVTQAWWDECVAPFDGIQHGTAEEHEMLRRRLLDLSNARRLFDNEKLLLEACTKFGNVNRAWKWLDGRHYSEFGFAHLDQVHGNRQSWACGCETQHAFDHYVARDTPEDVVHHAHTSLAACSKHKVFFGEPAKHRDVLQAESVVETK